MPKRQHNFRWKDDIQKKRHEEAEARNKIYAALSKEEKLALIDKRPGKSAKERARLTKES